MSAMTDHPSTPRVAGGGVADYLPRITAAAEHARSLDAAREMAHRQRNALIVEAIDAGVSQRAAAGAAGLAQSRVIRLLSTSQGEDLDG